MISRIAQSLAATLAILVLVSGCSVGPDYEPPPTSVPEQFTNSAGTAKEATLAKWLRNPRELVPGNRMTFAGLQKDEDIANVIAYLKTFGPDGTPPK